MESAEYGAAGERDTYGNKEGLDLLEEKHDMKVRMKRLEDQMARFVDQTEAQNVYYQAQIADLNARVNTLTKDAEGYHDIRHRFIDVYRRDVLGDHSAETRARINKGNATAHEGDAPADARLYTANQRNDRDVLTDLYGLTVDQILFLDRARIYSGFTALNAGAAWRAKGTANTPAYVAAAFQTFTTELIANLDQNLTDQSLIDDTTALGRANLAFLVAHSRGLRERRQGVTV
jgi:hypothetical protein